jgi:hypothetical protein
VVLVVVVLVVVVLVVVVLVVLVVIPTSTSVRNSGLGDCRVPARTYNWDTN